MFSRDELAGRFKIAQEKFERTASLPDLSKQRQSLYVTSSMKQDSSSSSDVVLSDSNVNKKIQSKFCKVISEYGVGTGCIIDDEKGLILSSFHLVGAIKSPRIDLSQYENQHLLAVLLTAGYLDDELRLTKEALEVKSKEEIIEKIKRTNENFSKFFESIIIDPIEARRLLSDQGYRKPVFEALQTLKREKNSSFAVTMESLREIKIIGLILLKSGHLNNNFSGTEKEIPQNLESIIPVEKCVHSITYTLEPQQQQQFIDIFINDKDRVIEQLFDFFQRAKNQKEVVLLTNTVEIEVDNEILIGEVALPPGIDQHRNQNILKNFAYFDTVPIYIVSFKNGPKFSEKTRVIRTGQKIHFLPDDHEVPMIGERVYFGGYPLTQAVYTFSTGMISSVTFSGLRRCFVIEAPIAPGNSGSPIFIQRGGQVYFIGIINSEVAHVSEKILSMKEQLKTMEEVMQVTGSNGERINFIESFREVTTTLLDNLSTGKGKAFGINSIEDLLDPNFVDHDGLIIDQFLDFLVPKKLPNDIREKAKQTIDGKKQTRVYESITVNGINYFLGSDNHGNKHTRLSNNITARLLENWHNTDATFNEEASKHYRDILRQTVEVIAYSDSQSNFVLFDRPIGWDKGTSKKGEATKVIELYYEDEGSHIRPKAESWWEVDKKLKEKKPIEFNIIELIPEKEIEKLSEAIGIVLLKNGDFQLYLDKKPTIIIDEPDRFNLKLLFERHSKNGTICLPLDHALIQWVRGQDMHKPKNR